MLEWLQSLPQVQVRERWALQQGNPCSTTFRHCCVCEIPQGATEKCSLQAGPQVSSSIRKKLGVQQQNCGSWCSFPAAFSLEEEVGNSPVWGFPLAPVRSCLQRTFLRAGVTTGWGPAAATAWNTITAVLGLSPCQGRGIAACPGL